MKTKKEKQVFKILQFKNFAVRLWLTAKFSKKNIKKSTEMPLIRPPTIRFAHSAASYGVCGESVTS